MECEEDIRNLSGVAAEKLKSVDKGVRLAAKRKAHELILSCEYHSNARLIPPANADRTSPFYDEGEMSNLSTVTGVREYRDMIQNVLALAEVLNPGVLDRETVKDYVYSSLVGRPMVGMTFCMDNAMRFYELYCGEGDLPSYEVREPDFYVTDVREPDFYVTEPMLGRIPVYRIHDDRHRSSLYKARLHQSNIFSVYVSDDGELRSVDDSDITLIGKDLGTRVIMRVLGKLIDDGVIQSGLQHLNDTYNGFAGYIDNDLLERNVTRTNMSWLQYTITVVRASISNGAIPEREAAKSIMTALCITDEQDQSRITAIRVLSTAVAMCGLANTDPDGPMVYITPNSVRSNLFVLLLGIFGRIPYSDRELGMILDADRDAYDLPMLLARVSHMPEIRNIPGHTLAMMRRRCAEWAHGNADSSTHYFDSTVFSLWTSNVISLPDDYVYEVLDYDHCSPGTLRRILECITRYISDPDADNPHPRHAAYFAERYCNERLVRLATSMATSEETNAGILDVVRAIHNIAEEGTNSMPMRSLVARREKDFAFRSLSDVYIQLLGALIDLDGRGREESVTNGLSEALSDKDMLADVLYRLMFGVCAHPAANIDFAMALRYISGVLKVDIDRYELTTLLNEVIAKYDAVDGNAGAAAIPIESIVYQLMHVLDDSTEMDPLPSEISARERKNKGKKKGADGSSENDTVDVNAKITCRERFEPVIAAVLNNPVNARKIVDKGFNGSITRMLESVKSDPSIIGTIIKMVKFPDQGDLEAYDTYDNLTSLLLAADSVGDTDLTTKLIPDEYIVDLVDSEYMTVWNRGNIPVKAIRSRIERFLIKCFGKRYFNTEVATHILSRFPGTLIDCGPTIREMYAPVIQSREFQITAATQHIEYVDSALKVMIILSKKPYVKFDPSIIKPYAIGIISYIRSNYSSEDAEIYIERLGLSQFIGKKSSVADERSKSVIPTIQLGSNMWCTGYTSGNGNVGTRSPVDSNVMLFSAEELGTVIPSGWHIPTVDDLGEIRSVLNRDIMFTPTSYIDADGEAQENGAACFWRQPEDGEEGMQIATIFNNDLRLYDVDEPDGCRAALRLVRD